MNDTAYFMESPTSWRGRTLQLRWRYGEVGFFRAFVKDCRWPAFVCITATSSSGFSYGALRRDAIAGPNAFHALENAGRFGLSRTDGEFVLR